MKKIITIVLAVLSIPVFAQKKGAYCDPSLIDLKFMNAQNAPANADLLEVGSPARFQFTLVNQKSNNFNSFIPAGTALLKVTLGTNCFLISDVRGADAPLSDYFRWTVDADPLRQTVLTGTLYRDYPVDMPRILSFSFMPSRKGTSLITCQFLITNDDNNSKVLSDLNPGNNIVSRDYTSFNLLAVEFLNVSAKAHSCNLDINWQVSADDNISSYVVETSGNGIDYVPVKTILSNGTKIYNLVLDNIAAGSIYVRIKAEATTGQSIFSYPVKVNNICAGKMELTLFPNPVSTYENELTIAVIEGIFNGSYNIRLLDAKGVEVNRKDAVLVNAKQVKYNTGFIPGGSYQLIVTGEEGVSYSLKFIKQ